MAYRKNKTKKQVFIYACIGFIVGFCLFLAMPAKAMKVKAGGVVEVGQTGSVYEIEEPSMDQVIKNKLQSMDMAKFKKEARDRIKKQALVYRPENAVENLSPANSYQVHKVSPEYVLPRDIKDIEGNVLFPKGYTFNPLEVLAKQGLSYPGVLVVLNGNRNAEINWFKKHFSEDEGMVKVLLTDGLALQVAQQLQQRTFYLTKKIKNKFQVTQTPSVIYQPENENVFLVQSFPVAGSNGNKTMENKKVNSDTKPIFY